MRKTQVALAALALVASSAAMAGVTVSGIVDGGLVSANGTTAFTGIGNHGTSQIGFHGSEDLGNGLKATFDLVGGMNLSTGAVNTAAGGMTTLFNRGATVGVASENVGLTLGTQISPAVLAALGYGTTAAGGDGAGIPAAMRLFAGKPGNFTMGGTATYVFFTPQSLNLSAKAAGFDANLQYRIVDKTSNESSYSALSIGTSVANVNVAFAYQAGNYASSSNNYATTLLAANTNFGDVRVNGAVASNTGNASGFKSTTYIVGASMPVAGALTAGLTYSNGTSTQGTALTGSLDYALGKSTLAYLNFSQFSVANGGTYTANDAAGITAAKTLTAVGLRHNF